MSAARRKRVWTVSDFAHHVGGVPHRSALRMLKRLDLKHAGALLIPSAGVNREFTFYAATLYRLEPDLFSPVESLEFRLEALEEASDAMKLDQRRIASQLGQNTRDIARLHRSRSSAA